MLGEAGRLECELREEPVERKFKVSFGLSERADSLTLAPQLCCLSRACVERHRGKVSKLCVKGVDEPYLILL